MCHPVVTSHGLLTRRPYQHHPVRHDYVLTEKGADLIPAIMALAAWGDRWNADEAGPPVRLHHQRCGHDTEPTVCCSHCGEPIEHEALLARSGPGAKNAPGTRVIADLLR
jgi:hypothetical protein